MTPSAGPPTVVGVDGGATRTRLAVADRKGGILARRESGPSLLGVGLDEKVADGLAREIEALVSELGERLPLASMCAGLAGAGAEDVQAAVTRRFLELNLARRIHVVSDAEAAFMDAFGEGEGILLVGGTGSVALCRPSAGARLRRVGGWGSLLGDEGSGFRLGVEGLRAAVRAWEGRGPETELKRVLFDEVGVTGPRELLAWSRPTDKSAIGALGPLVVRTAKDGDAVARELVERAVEALVEHVRALAAGLEEDSPPPVALAGGLLEEGGSLRARVIQELEERAFPLLRRPVDGARGAVRLALRL